MKTAYKALFVFFLIIMFHSFGTILSTGVEGLIGFIEWMISSSYVVLFLYANWDLLTAKK